MASGIVTEVIWAVAYWPAGRGLLHTFQFGVAAPRNVANAVSAALIVLASGVPWESYWPLVRGTRKKEPVMRRPRNTVAVLSLHRAPTPRANTPVPLLATDAPPATDHCPVSSPVDSSITSPELGIVHVTPLGTRDLRAVKRVTAAAKMPAIVPVKYHWVRPGPTRPVPDQPIDNLLRLTERIVPWLTT